MENLRILIRRGLNSLGRKKWFWIGLLILLPVVIVLDLIISFGFVLAHFYTSPWNPYLLTMAVTSAILGAVASKKKFLESKTMRDLGKLLFFISLFWVIRDYGIWEMFLFMAGILVTTRMLKWFMPKKTLA